MSALDTTIPPGIYDVTAITIADGAGNSVTVPYIGTLSWTQGRGNWVEARSRGRHASTPVAMKVADGNCAISLSGKATSFYGSSNTHILEALTGTGNAASWTSTGAGTQKMFRLAVTLDTSAASGGGSQTLTWTYGLLDDGGLDIQASDEDSVTFAASITALQEAPTVS